jgi:phi LC3 family holin
MKINWKVRIKNKAFWLAVIPAIALVAQAVAAVFGYTIDLTSIVGKLQAVVNAVFALLVILGIVVDPTTSGLGDSNRAMSYTEPWEDEPPIWEDPAVLAGMDPPAEDQPCPPMPKGEE